MVVLLEVFGSLLPLVLVVVFSGCSGIILLDTLRGGEGVKRGPLVVLSYSPIVKAISLLALGLPILCLYAAWRADTFLLTSLMCAFAVVTGYFTILAAYLTCCIRMAFDEDYVYYRSPTRARAITWKAVTRIGFSDAIQMHYLKAVNGEMFWLSRSMRGFDELTARARKKMAQAVSKRTA